MTWLDGFSARKSRADLEELLDGGAASDDALGRTVQAARAPGTPGERARQEAATAAFRTAQAGSAPRLPNRNRPGAGFPVLRRLATATLATKLVIGVAALAAGAVTYAAVDVNRAPAPAPTSPAHLRHPSSPARAPPSVSSRTILRLSTRSATSAAGAPTRAPSASRSNTPSPATPASSSASGAALAGLCRQWLALPGRHLGLASDPLYRPLFGAAGTPTTSKASARTSVEPPTSASTSTRLPSHHSKPPRSLPVPSASHAHRVSRPRTSGYS